MIPKPVENTLLRQLHGSGGHGLGALLNLRFRAALFGRLKRFLKRFIEPPARVLMLQRNLISAFHLPQNLRLPNNLRIQTAGDPKKMLDALTPHESVHLRAQPSTKMATRRKTATRTSSILKNSGTKSLTKIPIHRKTSL